MLIGLMILSMALLPVYIFPSGGFQLCDIAIFGIFLLTIFYKKEKNPFLKRQIKWIIPFAIWVLLINGVYSIIESDYISYWINSGTLVYCIFTMYLFSINFNKLLSNIKFIYLALFLSILLTLTTKGYYEEGIRQVFSFNNPNQLGYFAVLLLGNLAVLINWKKKYHLGNVWFSFCDVLLFLVSHLFALMSVSRAAMFAVFLIDLWFIRFLLRDNFYLSSIAYLAIITFGLTVGFKSSILNEKFANREKSINLSDNIKENIMRVQSQLVFQDPWQLLVGTGKGQGKGYRNANVLSSWNDSQLEVHNLFGDILRSYGMIGLILFVFWIVNFIRNSTVISGSYFIWGSLLLYNMSHNGIRFRSFWVFMALLIAVVNYMNMSNDSVNENRSLVD